jgi:hypothetical protein
MNQNENVERVMQARLQQLYSLRESIETQAQAAHDEYMRWMRNLDAVDASIHILEG